MSGLCEFSLNGGKRSLGGNASLNIVAAKKGQTLIAWEGAARLGRVIMIIHRIDSPTSRNTPAQNIAFGPPGVPALQGAAAQFAVLPSSFVVTFLIVCLGRLRLGRLRPFFPIVCLGRLRL